MAFEELDVIHRKCTISCKYADRVDSIDFTNPVTRYVIISIATVSKSLKMSNLTYT